jgi:hypothetical protein
MADRKKRFTEPPDTIQKSIARSLNITNNWLLITNRPLLKKSKADRHNANKM